VRWIVLQTAAEQLERLGYPDEAIPAWLALARDTEALEGMRAVAAKQLELLVV
jgi:hypothetical protein